MVAPTSLETKIVWVDERLNIDQHAQDYNDSALGARSNPITQRGQAPALQRTMPDGSTRLVKFDGIDGDVLIDRKWSIVRAPGAQAQARRQSEVLAQHDLIAIWEVPSEAERIKGIKFLRKLKIFNIKMRVAKPW
jgi:filamentous hemagglutinin